MDDGVGIQGDGVDVLAAGRHRHAIGTVEVDAIRHVPLVGKRARRRVSVPVDEGQRQELDGEI